MINFNQNTQAHNDALFSCAQFDAVGVNEQVQPAIASVSEHRLVKAAKCPTPLFNGVSDAVGHVNSDTGELIKRRDFAHNTKVIFEHKDWCDEYRIRTQTETPNIIMPPDQSGERKTNMLTLAGAQKLSESCRYVEKKRGGYSTFLTLTLDEEARARVAAGETVQKQISRFWDAAKLMYKRGWREELDGKIHYGKPHSDDLDYCWVVENPKNEHGEDNPHAHILMRWRVPYRDFAAWAARIERLWGQGFAHLEKIKEPEKAGAYMAKAAGYMTKSSESADQGEVRGNRYGISKSARATGWEVICTNAAGIFGSLINDVYDYFIFNHGGKMKRREWLKNKLEETPKSDKKTRQKIGKALESVRKELNDTNNLPLRPSKYQLVLVGQNALRAVVNWAKDNKGGDYAPWLPKKERGVYWDEEEKPEGVWRRQYRKMIKIIQMKRVLRHTCCEEWWQAFRRDHFNNFGAPLEKTADDYFLMT